MKSCNAGFCAGCHGLDPPRYGVQNLGYPSSWRWIKPTNLPRIRWGLRWYLFSALRVSTLPPLRLQLTALSVVICAIVLGPEGILSCSRNIAIDSPVHFAMPVSGEKNTSSDTSNRVGAQTLQLQGISSPSFKTQIRLGTVSSAHPAPRHFFASK